MAGGGGRSHFGSPFPGCGHGGTGLGVPMGGCGVGRGVVRGGCGVLVGGGSVGMLLGVLVILLASSCSIASISSIKVSEMSNWPSSSLKQSS